MTELAVECQLCLKEQVKDGNEPRHLHTLDRAKKVDGMGRICESCDGGVLDLANRSHDE